MENDDILEGRRHRQVSVPHEMQFKRGVQESWIGFIRFSASKGEIAPQFRILYDKVGQRETSIKKMTHPSYIPSNRRIFLDNHDGWGQECLELRHSTNVVWVIARSNEGDLGWEREHR
jgi:hypothetical protein